MANNAPARATVTCTVDAAPANICPPASVACNTFEIMGDSKVLLTLRVQSNMLDIKALFKHARRRARQVEGATAIRHGSGLYTI